MYISKVKDVSVNQQEKFTIATKAAYIKIAVTPRQWLKILYYILCKSDGSLVIFGVIVFSGIIALLYGLYYDRNKR